MRRSTLFNLLAISLFLLGLAGFFWYVGSTNIPTPANDTTPTANYSGNLVSAANVAVTAPTTTQVKVVPILAATSASVRTTSPSATQPSSRQSAANSSRPVSVPTSNQMVRIQNPYPVAPESFDQVNTDTRSALVNILCEPNGSTSLDPISGSGVIIDPRGVILTNAHVAQYVLLSESPQVNLRCFVRNGSPATISWNAAVLFIPPAWVNQHFSEINQSHPTGTGEHDYALLYITGTVSGAPLPAQFPYLPFDTRAAIGFPGDQVLVASYPAELVGGIQTEYGLYAATSITTIKQLLTFVANTPDVLSLGGIIEAQEGSSGGAVVNQWGRLIALIATTSDGTTTSQRDLRAVALSYINTDLKAESGGDLTTLLQGDPAQETQQFSASIAPGLIKLYVGQLFPQY